MKIRKALFAFAALGAGLSASAFDRVTSLERFGFRSEEDRVLAYAIKPFEKM